MAISSLRQRFGDELFKCCEKDDLVGFQKWVQQQKFNDWTALLTVSTQSDAEKIAGYCLQHGAKPDDGWVLESMAVCGAGRVHRLLVEHGLDINQYIEIWKDALASAVRTNNLSWVQFCLDKGADPNHAKLDDYRSLLAEAAGEGNVEIMQLLLDHGAERQNSGALIYAAEEGKAKSIKFLLEDGFDINEIGIAEPTDPRTLEDVGTALHKAIENHTELVDMLMDTNMKLRDGQGRTPLELAEQLGRLDIVEKLKAF